MLVLKLELHGKNKEEGKRMLLRKKAKKAELCVDIRLSKKKGLYLHIGLA